MNIKKIFVVFLACFGTKIQKLLFRYILLKLFLNFGTKTCQKNYQKFFDIHLFSQYWLIFLLFTYTWVVKVKWISEKWIAKKNCYSLLINIHLFLLFTYTWFGTNIIFQKLKLPYSSENAGIVVSNLFTKLDVFL